MEFNNLTLDQGELLRPYLMQDNICCEFSFGNNILWNPNQRMQYCFVEDVLVYRLIFDEKIIYCTPDFKGKMSMLLATFDADAAAIGKPYSITCLSEKMKNEMEANCGNRYAFSLSRDHYDYVYLVEGLAYLAGKKYHKKKNHLNQFLKNYEFVYEEIDETNREECRQMKNEWLEKRVEEGRGSEDLTHEAQIIDYALNHYDQLKFIGGLIRVDGKVVAMTMGEALNENTFVTHFEKGIEEYKGIYAAINQQFAANTLLGRFTYVNREEDLGLEGLRQAKLAYSPDVLYEKWEATRLEMNS